MWIVVDCCLYEHNGADLDSNGEALRVMGKGFSDDCLDVLLLARFGCFIDRLVDFYFQYEMGAFWSGKFLGCDSRFCGSWFFGFLVVGL